MRLLTGLVFPEDAALNKRAIARGEARKAEAETVGVPEFEILEPCLAQNCDDVCMLPDGHKGRHTWERRWRR